MWLIVCTLGQEERHLDHQALLHLGQSVPGGDSELLTCCLKVGFASHGLATEGAWKP